ncbi:MAG: PfkB family carbohydrate kinase [Gammaproteobacteria bacterium]|nr:PfkB family carbohydrate kinase [Gammaproteobacteria bacterium]
MDDRHQEDARPLIFGEVLFDIFPDVAVIGGAPFNVAWHLHGFGLRPVFVSRVGVDSAGEQVLSTMRSWGMDVSCMQIDDTHATGEVRVELTGNGHAFDILPDRAYDYIDADAAMRSLAGQDIGLIYHGTLALRSDVSRASLRLLRNRLSPLHCIDINLRSPWWQASEVKSQIDGATWVKLNDEELMLIGNDAVDVQPIQQRARALRLRHHIDTLIVTRGAQGALLVDADGIVEGAAANAGELVDTVGAGDAFSAVALIGLMRRWEARDTLRRALEFAAWICTLRGAVIDAPERYQQFMREWEVDQA